MKQPAPKIDLYIGQRLRQQRLLQGLSEAQIANRLGITVDQLRLFEKGVERIAPRILVAAAESFKISIGWFFEGISTSDSMPGLNGVNADVVRFLALPEAYPMMSAFIALKTPKQRAAAVASCGQ